MGKEEQMKKKRVRKGIVVSILAAYMVLGGAQETFTVRAAAHKETAKDYKEDMRHERKYNSDSSGHSE